MHSCVRVVSPSLSNSNVVSNKLVFFFSSNKYVLVADLIPEKIVTNFMFKADQGKSNYLFNDSSRWFFYTIRLRQENGWVKC